MSTERVPDDAAMAASESEPESEAAPAPESDSAPVAETSVAETSVAEPSVEAAAAEAAAVYAAAAEGAPATEPVVPAPEPEPALPAGPRLGTLRRIGRALRPVVTVGLFVVGVGLGYVAFQATRPLIAGSPTVVADALANAQTPPAVQDLVAALKSDDQNAVRAVLDSTPYRLLAGELASMNFQSIDGVDTLSTYTHDNLAATEIVIRGLDSQGNQTAINLVVHEKDNVIVSFR